jgi:hypothetical protein
MVRAHTLNHDCVIVFGVSVYWAHKTSRHANESSMATVLEVTIGGTGEEFTFLRLYTGLNEIDLVGRNAHRRALMMCSICLMHYVVSFLTRKVNVPNVRYIVKGKEKGARALRPAPRFLVRLELEANAGLHAAGVGAVGEGLGGIAGSKRGDGFQDQIR